MPNLELDKTLQVDGVTYNINAVKADKVANKLTVKSLGLTGAEKTAETISFDGNADKTISIVSAETGGKFKNAIRVPSVSSEAGKANKTENGIHAEAVLNYKDITDEVVKTLINTSTTATWIPKEGYDDPNDRESEDEAEIIYESDPVYFENKYTLTFTEDTKDSSLVNGICVVVGPGKKNEILHFAKYNLIKELLPYFIYVSTDTWNMWLGGYRFVKVKKDKDGNDINVPYVKRLAQSAVEAETANSANVADKLATPRQFSVSLETSNKVNFDGTANAPLGVIGTLDIAKGGTGATTAAAARTNLEITPANIGAAIAGHTHLYARSTTAGGPADVALTANADSTGVHINTNYYRCVSPFTSDINSITIKSSADYPSGIPATTGKNGDIMILY